MQVSGTGAAIGFIADTLFRSFPIGTSIGALAKNLFDLDAQDLGRAYDAKRATQGQNTTGFDGFQMGSGLLGELASLFMGGPTIKPSTRVYKPAPGESIEEAARATLARAKKSDLTHSINWGNGEYSIPVYPTDTVNAVVKRWSHDTGNVKKAPGAGSTSKAPNWTSEDPKLGHTYAMNEAARRKARPRTDDQVDREAQSTSSPSWKKILTWGGVALAGLSLLNNLPFFGNFGMPFYGAGFGMPDFTNQYHPAMALNAGMHPGMMPWMRW